MSNNKAFLLIQPPPGFSIFRTPGSPIEATPGFPGDLRHSCTCPEV